MVRDGRSGIFRVALKFHWNSSPAAARTESHANCM